MSYMQCQKCGGMFGVIGRAVYTCGCVPPVPIPEAPAATQEQPAGSEASENDLWLELAKILRFEKGDEDGDWFVPAEPQPLGPFFSILEAATAFMRFIDATDKAMREEIEQLRGGSPRKVGEDGASERIWCMECGKSVSTPVPKDTIVRAWVQCPECIEKGKGLCDSQTQK